MANSVSSALSDMVVETNLLRRIGAFAKRENSIQQALNFIRSTYIRIRAEIPTTVFLDLTRNNKSRIYLIGDFDKRVGLIIFEHDVVLRLIFLD